MSADVERSALLKKEKELIDLQQSDSLGEDAVKLQAVLTEISQIHERMEQIGDYECMSAYETYFEHSIRTGLSNN